MNDWERGRGGSFSGDPSRICPEDLIQGPQDLG